MRNTLISSAVCLLALAGAPAALAQEPPAPTAAAPLDPFEQMMAARSVADYARRTKDVQAMIVAARMLQEIPVIEQAPVGGTAAAVEGDAAGAFTAEGLFEEAKGLAKDDPTLLAQIRLTQSSGRGVLSSAFGSGLVRIVQNMGARASYVFPIKAKGGERLRIGAIGGANTKMLMRMRDRRGRVVCTDDSGDYAPVCSLDKPSPGGDYRVEVVNRSDAPSRTVILSN